MKKKKSRTKSCGARRAAASLPLVKCAALRPLSDVGTASRAHKLRLDLVEGAEAPSTITGRSVAIELLILAQHFVATRHSLIQCLLRGLLARPHTLKLFNENLGCLVMVAEPEAARIVRRLSAVELQDGNFA